MSICSKKNKQTNRTLEQYRRFPRRTNRSSNRIPHAPFAHISRPVFQAASGSGIVSGSYFRLSRSPGAAIARECAEGRGGAVRGRWVEEGVRTGVWGEAKRLRAALWLL